MIVVADTSPVTYLVQLSLEELLPALYGHVSLPEVVLQELLHERTPANVRTWALNPPPWISVLRGEQVSRPEVAALDAGERAAILAALALGADALLIDEKKGTRIAEALGLRVTRTLGILRDGDVAGLVDGRAAYERLRLETSFRQNDRLYDLFIKSLKTR